ncbi:hypothetical protein AB0N09_34055 [Streptomyces erythrochromogenes]|uniref:hypothetical protein n=1 Tax=Streptomyces erythrochromogenes TaxID=285574 RepID=UPI003412DDEF
MSLTSPSPVLAPDRTTGPAAEFGFAAVPWATRRHADPMMRCISCAGPPPPPPSCSSQVRH